MIVNSLKLQKGNMALLQIITEEPIIIFLEAHDDLFDV